MSLTKDWMLNKKMVEQEKELITLRKRTCHDVVSLWKCELADAILEEEEIGNCVKNVKVEVK